ncbi:hypothetical protein N0V87_006175 [Didymella glomerata]|uniref:Uncharacterized protein n=1 Tax=Didymella glomerata TaxID=749621 RepID=A0A9W8WX48_9PLEO|nr:hypothetical protein N0V87_006175 [Didymella glomerata]
MSIEAITLRNQTVSPLLRLPPEIRDRIYHFALLYDGVDNIYPAPNGVDFCTESHPIYGCAEKVSPHQRPEDLRPDIPLRSTCRQINHEARNVYFACNTFAIVNPIDFCGRDQYEDRHFKVPAMNEIKTVQLTVKTSAVFPKFGGASQMDQCLSNRIDDLKGMQKLSKIYVRIRQSNDHFPPRPPLVVSNLLPGFALPQPFPKISLKPEVVLKMIEDKFKRAGLRKATVHLVPEEKQERHPLQTVHDVRQWLDI